MGTVSKRITFLKTFLAALLAFCTCAQAKDKWWDAAWSARRSITIDTTTTGANITEPIGGATVLLRFFDANYPSGAKDDLSDLRFVATDGKTLLPFHVEKIDQLLGEAFVWVKLPEVKPNAKTPFWMYYGSNDAKAANLQDPKACYDAETVLVFHFAEDAQAAGDATKNANSAEAPGGKSAGAQIGPGTAFLGTNPVPITASPSLLWTDNNPVTISVWVKVTVLQPDAVILSRRDAEKSFILGVNNGTPFIEMGNKRAAANQPLTPNSWAHLAVVADAAKTTLYINGEQAAALGSGVPGMNTQLTLGGDTRQGATGITGELDELQIHKIARTPGFIQLAALGQGGDKAGKVIVIGEHEQPKNWLSWLTTGYFGVIVKNLTGDGWAVIIVLAIMAVISWYVMVSKVRYLNGISHGNELFMKQWRYVAADLTVLDSDDAEQSRTLGGRVTKENVKTLRRSSVYRIYHIGVEEIRHRLASDRHERGQRGLAGRSIQAIRAALDGGLVRETQKINKLIVLLTICISGGPFLGLLGTVVGVMITFAAVAAAGEVNVNAIAPGIAAALLATVAGLAVAIPSLFGYNYIVSRVKDAKDDMHIFIDEFVTKMAEFYKERND
jgi:biopolymer transport protein ExbB